MNFNNCNLPPTSFTGCGNQYPIVPGTNPAIQTWNGNKFVVADGSSKNQISLPFLQINTGTPSHVVGSDSKGVWSYYPYAVPTSVQNVAGGQSGNLVYQVAPSVTGFVSDGGVNQVLLSSGSGSPFWVNQSSLIAGSSATATNLTNSIVGSVPYTSGSNVTSFLSPSSTAGYVLSSQGANQPPAWIQNTAVTTSANNLTGGVLGSIPYQSAASTTSMLPSGQVGQFLQSNGSAAPSWSSSIGSVITGATRAIPTSGLKLWLDASQQAATTTDGANVNTFFDYSGNNNNLTNVLGTGQPTILFSGNNGLPALVLPNGMCMGNSTFFQNNGFSSGQISIFAVIRHPVAVPANSAAFYLNDYPPASGGYNLYAAMQSSYGNGTYVLWNQAGGGNPQATFPIGDQTDTTIVEFIIDSSNAFGAVNGKVNAYATYTPNYTLSAGLSVGYYNTNTFGNPVSTYISEYIVYNRGVTYGERHQIESYLTKKWLSPKNTLSCIGDSRTFGVYDTYLTSLPLRTLSLLGGSSAWKATNLGESGRKTGDLVSAISSESTNTLVDEMSRTSLAIGSLNVATIWLGVNDLLLGGVTNGNTIYNNYITASQTLRKNGYKIIWCTDVPQSWINISGNTTGSTTQLAYEATRLSANSLIRANWATYADGLADFGADPIMGTNGVQDNSTYYNSDKLHLIAGGTSILSKILASAINYAAGNNSPDILTPTSSYVLGNTYAGLATAGGGAIVPNLNLAPFYQVANSYQIYPVTSATQQQGGLTGYGSYSGTSPTFSGGGFNGVAFSNYYTSSSTPTISGGYSLASLGKGLNYRQGQIDFRRPIFVSINLNGIVSQTGAIRLVVGGTGVGTTPPASDANALSSSLQGFGFEIFLPPAWSASQTYALNSAVSSGGNYYWVSTAGTSGTIAFSGTSNTPIQASGGTCYYVYLGSTSGGFPMRAFCSNGTTFSTSPCVFYKFNNSPNWPIGISSNGLGVVSLFYGNSLVATCAQNTSSATTAGPTSIGGYSNLYLDLYATFPSASFTGTFNAGWTIDVPALNVVTL